LKTKEITGKNEEVSADDTDDRLSFASEQQLTFVMTTSRFSAFFT